MAIIKKDGNFMGLPMNIARGNPIPLDRSEIWYSFSEMENYAKESPVAYVGQILGLVDEVNGSATAYIILNTNGDIKEVGKATVVDNTTIVLNEETLSLKDFGKRFYKYIPESGSKEENNYVAARYELQEVDDEHPWRAGLEPKVVNENGILSLGWFEPNPTTVEGLSAAITSLQSTTDNLITDTATLSSRLDNTYTKLETEQKIASAAHLKRVKIDKPELIDPNADGADQYIYMVPSGLEAEDNKYYEYMVVEVEVADEEGTITTEKRVERVGSWEVDLSEYAKQSTVDDNYTEITGLINELNELLQGVDSRAEVNIINSVSDDFVVDENNNRQLQLVSVPVTIDLTTNTSLLDFFVKRETGKDLITDAQVTKLQGIEENAEKNVIAAVNAEEFTVTDDIERKLSINKIDGAKLINLDNNEMFNAVKTDVNTAKDNIGAIQKSLDGLNSSITNIHTNYVLKTTYENDMSEVWDRLTWHEL